MDGIDEMSSIATFIRQFVKVGEIMLLFCIGGDPGARDQPQLPGQVPVPSENDVRPMENVRSKRKRSRFK
jgi:hypothetical protein